MLFPDAATCMVNRDVDANYSNTNWEGLSPFQIQIIGTVYKLIGVPQAMFQNRRSYCLLNYFGTSRYSDYLHGYASESANQWPLSIASALEVHIGCSCIHSDNFPI